MAKKPERIEEGSLRQAMYAQYKGETEAHIRMAKGYIRKHRAGSARAYTRRAWKTAWEARRQLKGFSKPKGTFQRIARTSMMGVSKSKHWHKLMKRADKARLDPSIPYGITRAGRDPRFILTIGEQKMSKLKSLVRSATNNPSLREVGTTTLTKHYADETPGQGLTYQLQRAKESITEAAEALYGPEVLTEVLTEWGNKTPTGNRAARLRTGAKRPPGSPVKLRARGTRHQINRGKAPKPKTKARTTGLAARATAVTQKAKSVTGLRQRLQKASKSMRIAARSAMLNQ